MKKEILVLKGDSQYNVLRIAADIMAKAFEMKGYHVTVLDLTEEGERLNDELEKKPALVFSIQALLFDCTLEDGQTSVFGVLNDTKFFGYIMDHPIYHGSRLKTTHGDNMYIGCIDRSHEVYIKKYYSGVKNVLFLAHGGFTPERIIPYEERNIELFFPCSYRKPSEVLKKIQELPEVYRNMANILKEEMLKYQILTLQDALELYLNSINFSYSKEEFTELMCLLSVVDQYIHEFTRDKCIRELIERGIQITVSGSGWDDFESEHGANIQVLSAQGMDFMDVLATMANSKMVLNHVPTLQNGMHERIFTSMICGAICITNDFPIVQEEFCDGENVVLYSNSNVGLLADRIKEILNSPEKAKQIASAGKRIAEDSHTWEKNAEAVLKIVGLETD